MPIEGFYLLIEDREHQKQIARIRRHEWVNVMWVTYD